MNETEPHRRYFEGITRFDIPAQALLDRGITGLLSLVPFCRDGDTLDVIERAAELVKAQATTSEQSANLLCR